MMKLAKALILIMFLFLSVPTVIHTTTVNIKIDPIQVEKEKIKKNILKVRKIDSINPRIVNGIYLTSKGTGFSTEFLVALVESESEFKINARSKKGYKGLLQTPTATGYPEVDILHGACILQDKLKETKGNFKSALILYKGGGKNKHSRKYKVAKKQVEELLCLYGKVKNSD